MITNVKRDWLLAKLRENRKQHRAIFEEALEGYRNKAIENLNAQIEAFKSMGKKPIRVNVNMPVPEDHTSDYNRVIGLLEASGDDEVRLSDVDYEQYVLDKWDWKDRFMISNSGYSTVARDYLKQQEEDAAEREVFI